MEKAFFIDTTLCMACRGCQVACKQWHNLPAVETINRGSYQNPADLSFDTYKLVRMTETVINDKLHWLFFPDQCRHCIEPPCADVADDPGAIFKDPATGAVIYTARTRGLDADDIIASCPYNIPRKAADGALAKCDMCLDRVENGLLPACVKTCPTGAMNFGDIDAMLEMAEKRLVKVQETYADAVLIDPQDVQVIYLTAFDPLAYYQNAMASNHCPAGMTRYAALRKLVHPLTSAMRL